MAKSAWSRPTTGDDEDGGGIPTGPSFQAVKETMALVNRAEALQGLINSLEAPKEGEVAVACIVCAQGHVHDSALVDRGHLGSFIREELARTQDELRRMGVVV